MRDKLDILQLKDNFDIWRDIFNRAIDKVNDIPDIPEMGVDTSGLLLSNTMNEDGTYELQWADLKQLLKDLGISTGEDGGASFPTVGSYLPNGLTAGSTGYTYLKPNGDIENSGQILNHGGITSDGNIVGNKITSKTSMNAQNLELTADTPYIDFNYGNTTSDYTSRIIESKSGVLSINGNEISATGSSFHTDIRLFTDKNDIVFRNDDNDFSILLAGHNGDVNSLRPFTINIKSGKVTIKPELKVETLKVTKNASITGTLTVSGATTLNQKLTVKGGADITGDVSLHNNVTIGGTLHAETLDVKNMSLNVNSLDVKPNIHSGANSSFDSDLYINNSKNSLIIRNDGTNVYLMMSDTVNGQPNNKRPFSFAVSSGDVSLHNTSVNGTIKATGQATLATTFVSTLQTNDATGHQVSIVTGGRVYNSVFNDYAEFFERGENTEEGDIISLDIDSDTECYIKATNKDTIVGVHSESYGHILGGTASTPEENKAHYIPVGLCGRVKTKIYGTIHKGQSVVLSDIPGVGIAFDESKHTRDDIIGFVVENKETEDIGLVRMMLR